MATVAKGKRRTVAETKSYFAHRKRSLWYIYQTIPGTGAAVIVNREGAPTARKAWARLIGEAASVALNEPERIRFTVGEADDLLTRRPEATIGTHSPSRSKDLAPRENREPDVTRYSGRVAARVRALRIAKGMSVDELRLALERHGVVLVNSALYAYENGNRQINPDHYPALAKVLGVKSVREFLPGK